LAATRSGTEMSRRPAFWGLDALHRDR